MVQLIILNPTTQRTKNIEVFVFGLEIQNHYIAEKQLICPLLWE